MKEHGLVILYTLTVFLSAGLLFSIQPMIAKTLLPVFGGGSSVWTTCMLFYQTLLLLGYLYAHILMTKFGRRSQMVIHGLLLVVALAVGVLVDTPEAPAQASTFPVPWLILQLALVSGLPFFAISSAGPLIQGWFSRTGHARAHDPYFLYAASNAGSLIGLLAYPLIFEPNMGLMNQRKLWLFGFGVFVLLAMFAVGRTKKPVVETAKEAKRRRKAEARETPVEVEIEAINWKRRLRWIYLAFIPSSMLLSVTTYITTDVVSLPLLWVLPLVVYLITMIIAFGSKSQGAVKNLTRPMVLLVIGALILLMADGLSAKGPSYYVVLLEFFLLFTIGVVCHGRLAMDRPRAVHLTEFFLYMSVGGALGGVFNGIVGPLLFDTNLEYSITLVLSVSILPWSSDLAGLLAKKVRQIKFLRRVAVPVFLIVYILFMEKYGVGFSEWINGLFIGADELASPINMTLIALMTAVPAFLIYLVWKDGLACAITLSLPMIVVQVSTLSNPNVIHLARTFYGTHQVVSQIDFRSGFLYHSMEHGTTTHGIQVLDPELVGDPMGYYHKDGPCGMIMDTVVSMRPGGIRGAFLGLGSGAISAYGRSVDEMVFFEIDPEVESIARNPKYFTYLSDSAAKENIDIRLGDARKLLEESEEQGEEKFDIILADAFSSDSIPVHLLTVEAMNLYFDRLTDDGIVALHISNRYLELMPLIEALAKATTPIPPFVGDESLATIPEDEHTYHLASRWVVLTRDIQTGQRLIDHGMQLFVVAKEDQVKAWTDDFSNILSVMELTQ